MAVASHEKVHTHDAEDEPKDKTHKQDIEDCWNSLNQSVNDNLKNVITMSVSLCSLHSVIVIYIQNLFILNTKANT